MINIQQMNNRSTGGKTLKISYIKQNGALDFMNIDVPHEDLFEWVECRENDQQKDPTKRHFLKNTPLKKKVTKNLNKYRIIEVLESLNQETKDIIYKNNEARKWFIDIENDKDAVTGEWPKPFNPTGQVTAIAAIDSFSDKVFLFGLKPLSDTELRQMEKDANVHISEYETDIKIEYLQFEAEDQMLKAYWKFTKQIYFLTGWNFTGYDWEYLINRSTRLGLDPYQIMGTKEMYTKTPQHKIVVDYLELYKKFDHSVLKENFTLDYTASQVLKGIKKISYPGTLDQLYKRDFYKYMLYNVIDTYLVKLIDKELQLASLYMTIGTIAMSEAHILLKTIAPIENILTRYYLERDAIITPNNAVYNGSLAYEGGFVFDPKKGLSKYVLAYDFASLYPSTQIQFNISPETFRGIDMDRELQQGEVRLPNGAIFDNSKDSVCRVFLGDYYRMRKESKNLMLTCEEQAAKLEKLIA